MKKYIAELIGTFTLALLVGLSLVHSISIATPIIAGLVLMLFVYTIGGISGCHINPAITLGLMSIKKISVKEGIIYIIIQFIAGFVALMLISALLGKPIETSTIATSTPLIFLAELMGTFLFGFGVAAVVDGRVEKSFSGVVVGGSLLMGIICAALVGSNGVLNPAVALGISSMSWIYLIAPIPGSILGMQVFSLLSERERK